MDFTKIMAATRTIAVPYCGETVAVTYNPAVFGPHYAEWLGEAPRTLHEDLARQLVGWNLSAGGVTLPPTVEVMRGEHPAMRAPVAEGEEEPPAVPLPPAFLRAVEARIGEDLRETATGKTTSATSPAS